ncbi:MAG: hypothetical protein A2889_01675 [Nitrospinae bacterium RIFCSPLOWO2_01_FULL_39_10]|nr:MAG: hypothetical protein A2889_01675 [Nitrospinae bacterium RIFCSPLOWO2_01_FULL_39_10]
MIDKPSDREEEFFARQEFERRKKSEEEKRKKMMEEEKKKLKELHHMHCPKCGMNLIEIDYKGIKIDKCSGCEGIWLDAGELEAVVEAGHKDKGFLDKMFTVFKK